jgi:hypothetical protein
MSPMAGGLQLRVIADPVVSSFSPMAFSALGGQVPPVGWPTDDEFVASGGTVRTGDPVHMHVCIYICIYVYVYICINICVPSSETARGSLTKLCLSACLFVVRLSVGLFCA